jgi:hypothetical protein
VPKAHLPCRKKRRFHAFADPGLQLCSARFGGASLYENSVPGVRPVSGAQILFVWNGPGYGKETVANLLVKCAALSCTEDEGKVSRSSLVVIRVARSGVMRQHALTD